MLLLIVLLFCLLKHIVNILLVLSQMLYIICTCICLLSMPPFLILRNSWRILSMPSSPQLRFSHLTVYSSQTSAICYLCLFLLTPSHSDTAFVKRPLFDLLLLLHYVSILLVDLFKLLSLHILFLDIISQLIDF